jgi:type I restriction enzyme R subunit
VLGEALPVDEDDLGGIDLGDTALQFIGHEAGVVDSGSIPPGKVDGLVESFTGAGRGGEQDPVMVRLSELIESFNSRFSIDISHADALMLFVELPAHLAADEGIRKAARDNTEEQFTESIKKDDVAGAIFDRQERSDQLLRIFTEDAHFAAEAMKHIRAETYRTARA